MDKFESYTLNSEG